MAIAEWFAFAKPAVGVLGSLWARMLQRWNRGWNSDLIVTAEFGDQRPDRWRSCQLNLANSARHVLMIKTIRSLKPTKMLIAPVETWMNPEPLIGKEREVLQLNWGIVPCDWDQHKTRAVCICAPPAWKRKEYAVTLELKVRAMDNRRTESVVWVKTESKVW